MTTGETLPRHESLPFGALNLPHPATVEISRAQSNQIAVKKNIFRNQRPEKACQPKLFLAN